MIGFSGHLQHIRSDPGHDNIVSAQDNVEKLRNKLTNKKKEKYQTNSGAIQNFNMSYSFKT